MSEPVVFMLTDLEPAGKIRVEGRKQGEGVGWVEVEMREQFPVGMKGEFDMWFKVNEKGNSPEKDSGRPKRVGRIRLKVSLTEHSVPSSPTDLPEGLAACPRCAYLEKLLVAMELEIEGKFQVHSLKDDFGPLIDPVTEETALDTEETPQHDLSPENAEIEHLKLVILALTQRISVLQTEQVQVNTLKKQLSACENAKYALENQSISVFEQLKREIKGNLEEIGKLKDEIGEKEEEIVRERGNIRDLKAEIGRLETEIQGKQGWEEAKKGRETSNSHLISQNESLIQQLLVQEAEFEALQTKFHSKMIEFEDKIKDWKEEMEKMNQEKGLLRSENDDLRKSLNSSQSQIDKLRLEISGCKSNLSQIQAEKDYISSSFSHEKCTFSSFTDSETQKNRLNSEFMGKTEKYEGKIREMGGLFEKLREENRKLRVENGENEKEIVELGKTVEKMRVEREQTELEGVELRKELEVLREERELGRGYRDRLEKDSEWQATLIREMDFVCNSLMSVSERSYKVSSLVPKMKAVLDEKDVEVEVLRSMVAELQKSRSVYVPASNDPVDSAVASFVNTHSHMPVPFSRQDEGLYLFGTKRVFIKLENGNIVSTPYLVRVGGGFMRVEEFVQVYTPLELCKLQTTREKRQLLRSELMSRLAANSHEERRNGKLEMSPQRAAKLIKEFLEDGGEQFATCFALQRKPASPTRSQRWKGTDLRSSQQSS